MSTQSMHRLVDAVAEEARRAGTDTTDDAIRRQAAFVRALVDEVERVHPASFRITALHEQLAEELAALAQLLHASPPAPAPTDVLAVDDDERRAVAAALRHLGYPFRTTPSAEEALHEHEREPAAIVLSPFRMPGMSGLDLCRALKRREVRPYVILVTAFHDDASLREGVRAGADDFVDEPVDPNALEARLAAASHLVRAYRAVTQQPPPQRDRQGAEASA